jgi:methionine synthase I (cobalamin-dependent)
MFKLEAEVKIVGYCCDITVEYLQAIAEIEKIQNA